MAIQLSTTVGPELPPELEHAIFEIAALSRPMSIPVLVLVAARVKDWVEPLLYRVLYCTKSPSQREMAGFPVFTVEIVLRIIDNKPQDFLQRSVRHLFLENADASEVDSILRACNHVTNLFEYFTPTPHLRTLGALQHLRRLTVGLPHFLERFNLDNPPPVFNNITHLELMDTYWDPAVLDLCARLPLMPHLTHLALNTFSTNDLLCNTLRAEASLRCIVVLLQNNVDIVDTHPLADDDRFMCIHQQKAYRRDWLHGADTGDDYWAFADAFIAARRAGQVDASWYSISDTDESWRT